MANITTLEPIRYTQDQVTTYSHGLAVCGENKYVNLTNADTVTQITVSTVPASLPASVNCKIAFKTTESNSNWFKLDSSGQAVTLETQEISEESILSEGNSIAELSAITNAPALANKQIRYAIAMTCSDPDNMHPCAKLDFTCGKATQQLTNTFDAATYQYEKPIVITSITADSETSGNATLQIQAQWLDTDTGELTQWQNSSSAVGAITSQISFRATATVPTTDGSAASILNSLVMQYNFTDSLGSGSGTNEIYSVIKDWRRDLRHCRINVKHAPLDKSSILAYVAFRPKIYKVTGEIIGTGTGAKTVYALDNPNGIRLESVKVYINGVLTYGTFDVNCETGSVILEAASGSVITCDYEYGWEAETWQEAEIQSTESFDGYDLSTYAITLPENNSGVDNSMAEIKLVLQTLQGSTDREPVGTGTGRMATYQLSNPVTDGLQVYSNGILLNATNYSLGSDPRYISIAAANGAELRVSYNWISPAPVVYEFSGIFSE